MSKLDVSEAWVGLSVLFTSLVDWLFNSTINNNIANRWKKWTVSMYIAHLQ